MHDRIEARGKRGRWPRPTYFNHMLFGKVDAWVGQTLLIPPVIKLCQWTRQTQFAVSRSFWFIAALDAFYRADTLFSSILWGGMNVLMMITAIRRADSPAASFIFFGMMALLFFIVDVLAGVLTGELAGVEFWVLVLTAEYAATIRTIPPVELAKSGVGEASINR